MLEIAGLISHQDTREEIRKAEQYDENLGNLILSLIEKIGEREKNAYATFEKYLSFATIHER